VHLASYIAIIVEPVRERFERIDIPIRTLHLLNQLNEINYSELIKYAALDLFYHASLSVLGIYFCRI